MNGFEEIFFFKSNLIKTLYDCEHYEDTYKDTKFLNLYVLNYIDTLEQKRFYTRGTLRGISISRLTKNPTLYPLPLAEILKLRKGLII